jgi:hypothetical protein
MRLSHTITLFSEPEPSGLDSWSYLASLLVHGTILGLLSYGIISAPQISDSVVNRYTMRQIELYTAKPRMAAPARGRNAGAPSGDGAAQQESAKLAEARTAVQVAQLEPGRQTLVRPDLPANLSLPEVTPVPTVMIWTPQKTPVIKIVPPQPEAATAVDVKPANDPPNEALNLDDRSVSSSELSAESSHLFPSTTSPIVVQGPEAVQMIPATTSESDAQPTPAAVMALSDLRMEEGIVTLPPANETLAPSVLSMPLGMLASTSQAGVAGLASPDAGGDSQQAVSNQAEASVSAQNPATEKRAGVEDEQQGRSPAGSGPSTGLITQPENGQYPVVVVGSNLEEEYPEIFQIWAGRLANTVYLQIGESKSWIMQYSLPLSSELAPTGDLDPPWPYHIIRPRFTHGDVPANSIVVHGRVSKTGRFESLAVVYPTPFAYASFLLNILQRWQFRPAVHNVTITEVEIVLVIPEDTNSSE